MRKEERSSFCRSFAAGFKKSRRVEKKMKREEK
jgi:hypothetical protein